MPGGARISTTKEPVAGLRTTSAHLLRPATSAGLLTTFVFLFLGAAVAAAAPAAAIDDPTRPDARVTHGPSCEPGGLVVQVVAGTAPYAVRLATTRTPSGEDEAQLQPGETAILRSGNVAWGETIDGRLEFTAADGSTHVDELQEYSFTRPTQEDCAAVALPTTPEPVPPTSTSPSAAPAAAPTSAAGAGAAPASVPSSTGPAPSTPLRPSGSVAPVADEDPEPPTRVGPGETVTLEAGGFLPGERVTIRLHERGDVLGTATAGPDGAVQAEIRIPGNAAAGRTTVDLVGVRSAAVADVELQVAGAQSVVAADDWSDLVPLTAAAVALVGSVSGLLSVAGGRRAAQRHAVFRSA
ncbi:hypothetical protein FHU33_4542 [Blastococcus colisei]|uniref:Uncharacterized protein n=1 Tax=Blastococcus colisei TaxID=1564162 RepID=A0A543P1A1_9ACTN|nr:hypothetical protein [Blastococcus colisei]TQN37872.1 hypothetical protein FHU33_4542 [Blastococcus colisei]